MPPCAIEFTGRFRGLAHKLQADRQKELEEVLQRLSATFGQPHLHSGLGIRRLRGSYFECRLDRDLRLVFKLDGNTLVLALLGDHNDVRRFIKDV
jgi:mRNA-degrading endonuclease YafQ of YafQ-DinJ toxin-antitoxin module